LSPEPLVILDTTMDPRFITNPLVTGGPGIRFYAGAPLITSTGFRLGTFCLVDVKPKPAFTADEIVTLQEFARSTMEVLAKRRAGYAENAQQSEAELIADARKDLFALVAHEIRSPIASMISLTRIIDERIYGPLSDPRYEELISALAEVAEQVGVITDRMLDFARLGAGEVDLADENVYVAELLQSACSATQEQANAKGIEIEIEPLAENLSLSVDRILSLQMLCHLISNAIASSAAGGSVRFTVAVATSGELNLRITDNGSNLSDDAISDIVDEHGIVGPAVEIDPRWTGFGLPLVRRLVELHGGRLLLAPAETSGAVATLRFPAYRVLTPA
jgi:two-component system, sensor histidine kinase